MPEIVPDRDHSTLTNLLFGTTAGITDDQVTLLLAAGVPCLLLLLLLGRPLRWASLDPETTAAHGVPVRLVSAAFLLLPVKAIIFVGELA